MKKIFSARFRVIFLGGIIALATVGAFSIAGAWMSTSENTNAAVGIVPVFAGKSTDGDIQYGYSIELQTRFADAGVTYDYLTKDGIANYVAFNKAALQRLTASAKEDSTLPVLITFAYPLTQVEFEALVAQYHIQVKTYTIWEDNSDGTTTTILGAPSDTELIPTGKLDSVLADVATRGGKNFLGWVEVDGSVMVGNLNPLAQDHHVFLIDVTEALIREKFTDAAMKQAGIPPWVREAVLGRELQIRRPPLAWQVRELVLGKVTP